MINQIFTEAAEGLNEVSFYDVSLDNFMYNHEVSQAANFPSIVLFNDITTTETIDNGGRYRDTQFSTRWLFADKIEILDDKGLNVLEIQDRMRQLARQYILNVTRNKTFQMLNNEQQSFTFESTSFAHEFDSDLTGVFVSFNFSLRLPQDYCKFEC